MLSKTWERALLRLVSWQIERASDVFAVNSGVRWNLANIVFKHKGKINKWINQLINYNHSWIPFALVKLTAGDAWKAPWHPPPSKAVGESSWLFLLLMGCSGGEDLLEIFVDGFECVKQLSLNLGLGDHNCHVNFFRRFEICHTRIEQLLRYSTGIARNGLESEKERKRSETLCAGFWDPIVNRGQNSYWSDIWNSNSD